MATSVIINKSNLKEEISNYFINNIDNIESYSNNVLEGKTLLAIIVYYLYCI